jgi:hypothetical protein
MSWRRWNWLDDGILPLAVIILRTCWIWIWLAWLQRWLTPNDADALLPVGMVFAVLLAGAVAARGALRFPSIRARIAVAVFGFVAILAVLWLQLYRVRFPVWNLRWVGTWANEMVTWADWETTGIPLAFFGFCALAFLWLRGILDGGRLSFLREQIWGVFASGFLALALALLLAHFDENGLPAGASDLLWLYFATGMVALAISGLKDAGGLRAVGAAREDSDVRPRFDRYWVGSVVSVMAGLLLLALAVSALVAPEAASQVLRSVWVIARQGIIYLWFAVSLLLLPIAYVLALVLAPLMDRLAGIQLEFQVQFQEAFKPEELKEAETGVNAIKSLPDGLRWVALAVLIVIVGLAFALTLRRLLSAKREEDVDEKRESVLSRDLLQGQLADLWRSLINRVDRRKEAPIDPFFSLDGEPQTRRIIRSIYQALLTYAQENNMPRPRERTPIEFGLDVAGLFPDSGDAIGVITDAYIEARYSSLPPPDEKARRVREAWQSLLGASREYGDAETDVE